MRRGEEEQGRRVLFGVVVLFVLFPFLFRLAGRAVVIRRRCAQRRFSRLEPFARWRHTIQDHTTAGLAVSQGMIHCTHHALSRDIHDLI